ncbi:MAG: hypothetical protein IT262_05070 [Saprospiraceae bacterium]|nr:hypothetical protein [Saprospiraceae bacterium]
MGKIDNRYTDRRMNGASNNGIFKPEDVDDGTMIVKDRVRYEGSVIVFDDDLHRVSSEVKGLRSDQKQLSNVPESILGEIYFSFSISKRKINFAKKMNFKKNYTSIKECYLVEPNAETWVMKNNKKISLSPGLSISKPVILEKESIHSFAYFQDINIVIQGVWDSGSLNSQTKGGLKFGLGKEPVKVELGGEYSVGEVLNIPGSVFNIGIKIQVYNDFSFNECLVRNVDVQLPGTLQNKDFWEFGNSFLSDHYHYKGITPVLSSGNTPNVNKNKNVKDLRRFLYQKGMYDIYDIGN